MTINRLYKSNGVKQRTFPLGFGYILRRGGGLYRPPLSPPLTVVGRIAVGVHDDRVRVLDKEVERRKTWIALTIHIYRYVHTYSHENTAIKIHKLRLEHTHSSLIVIHVMGNLPSLIFFMLVQMQGYKSFLCVWKPYNIFGWFSAKMAVKFAIELYSIKHSLQIPSSMIIHWLFVN